MKKNSFLILAVGIGLSWGHLSAKAQTEPEGSALRVSLLTCGPGDAVYELYGHTALRVQDRENGQDWVFNYGVFDFRAPHFEWRFILGQTDFTLGVSPFWRFAQSYGRQGRWVVEQELNLLPQERQRLWQALLENSAVDGWTYRYSFLYDNCSTRALDQIRHCLDGNLVWPETQEKKTYRSLLHEYTAEASPWNAFGQDLVLGAEVDRPLQVEEETFLPISAQHWLGRVEVVAADGSKRPLVTSEQLLVPQGENASQPLPLRPWAAMALLLAGVCAVSIWDYRRGKLSHWIDNLLMVGQGMAGLIVAFLFFCSVHPAVGSNWLLLVLHPLPLLYLPVKYRREKQGKTDYYYRLQLLPLAVYALTAVAGVQAYPAAFHSVVAALALRGILPFALRHKEQRSLGQHDAPVLKSQQ